MVNRKNLEKFALISVFEKKNLYDLCLNLKNYNYNFISTGNTCKEIKKSGFDCDEVSKLTNFQEILDGRVKTIHPKIYGSILYRDENKNDVKEFKRLKFPKINLVIVDLYPFEKYSKSNNELNKTIEMIDIGGVGLLRAASKNYKRVTAICDTNDYGKLIKNIQKNNGITDQYFRKFMAFKAFSKVSDYDNKIAKWIYNKKNSLRKIKLKYGENPNQKSFIIENNINSIFKFQIQGKKISYNNIIDVDSGMKCLNEFKEPTCVIIKHTNPCGVASDRKINNSIIKALNTDKESSFGGIVLINRKLDLSAAKILSEDFFEIVVAPDFDKKALKIFGEKKKLIVLKIKKLIPKSKAFISTSFGSLYQKIDYIKINKKFIKLASSKRATEAVIKDLIFALKVAKHLKSNSVVLAKNNQTIGIGAGQTSRVKALKIAINHAKKNNYFKNYVCASDGFFPFTDSLSILNKQGCSAVVQPFGSINDKNNIKYANKNNIKLYFCKNRLFKH